MNQIARKGLLMRWGWPPMCAITGYLSTMLYLLQELIIIET
jgi:hypothetical protein